MTGAPPVTITFDGVSVMREQAEILRGIDLRLAERRVAFIGRNGSGKSTLLRLINGLDVPTRGTVTVDGRDSVRDGRAVREHVGFTFQHPETQLVLPTVAEDLALGLPKDERKDGRAARRITAVLAELGIASLEQRLCHELSGGETQLVALAGALVRAPGVLVMDEPTTFLDLRYAARLRAAIDALEQTVVLATHDLELAADCERVIVIDDGAIAFDGAPAPAIARYRELAAWT